MANTKRLIVCVAILLVFPAFARALMFPILIPPIPVTGGNSFTLNVNDAELSAPNDYLADAPPFTKDGLNGQWMVVATDLDDPFPFYWEFQLPTSGSYKLMFTDTDTPGSLPVTISNAGFFTSNTEIPLDNLKFVDNPPTGPSFSPLPLNLDMSYSPGSSGPSYQSAVVPLPMTVWMGLALIGTCGLMACVRRTAGRTRAGF